MSKVLNQMAEEAQLKAEKIWVIQTLKKILECRNSLQIERLHMESIDAANKAKLAEVSKKAIAVKRSEKKAAEASSAASSLIELEDELVTEALVGLSRWTVHLDKPIVNEEVLPVSFAEAVCNQEVKDVNFDEPANDQEVLNLSVSKSVFRRYRMETPVEEFDDEDEEMPPGCADINVTENSDHEDELK